MSGFSVIGQIAVADTVARQNQYPAADKEEYLIACQASSQQQGLDQQQAKTLCQCTLEQFQAKYTIDQFKQLYTQAQQNSEPPDELVQVGLFCASQLSQEQ